jgi:hypothetical protein
LGSSIVSFLFASLLVSSIGFLFRIPITSGHFWGAVGITLLYVILSWSLHPGQSKVFQISMSFILLVSSFYVCLMISRNLSFHDGQAYHQKPYSAQLMEPLYEQLTSLQSKIRTAG